MKTKMSYAAQRAGLHPLNFLLSVSQMVGGLSDCWPEVDDGYVETLLALNLSHAFKNPGADAAVPSREPGSGQRTWDLPLSKSAAKILDKLERGNRWARKAISFDTLRNHFCKGVAGLDHALEELVENGLVLAGSGRKGPYSLNPEKKGDIERMMRAFREREGG